MDKPSKSQCSRPHVDTINRWQRLPQGMGFLCRTGSYMPTTWRVSLSRANHNHCWLFLWPTKVHISLHSTVSRCVFLIFTSLAAELYFWLTWFCSQENETSQTLTIPRREIFSRRSLSMVTPVCCSTFF